MAKKETGAGKIKASVNDATDGGKSRDLALTAAYMPTDFSLSLDSYRRGGTDRFLAKAPDHLQRQPMRGFDPTYVNIIDYIVRITHRIWEEKNIGYIYDCYSHDCRVWDDVGLQYGRDKIVADTVHTNNAFPDIRLVADEVIWAGDEQAGFHTSHRTMILGTNTGFSRFGAPTGKPVKLLCIANCVARDNEIYREHVAYDTAGMLKQLGLDVVRCAREAAASAGSDAMPANFMASHPVRLVGQGKPASHPIPDRIMDVEDFVHAAFQTVWNRRDVGALDRLYAPSVVFEGSSGRVYRGVGQLRSFILSMIAMFPDLALAVEDLYWMGNRDDGFLIMARWGATGAHRGHGPYGEPSGREVHLWGISQWLVEDDKIQKEWTVFNEFGALMQIYG